MGAYEWLAKVMIIYENPSNHFSKGQLFQFLRRLKEICCDDTPLDYDRLVGFSVKSRLALFQKCREFIVKSVKLREELLECASTTLELALWKAALNQSLQQNEFTNAENDMIREESQLVGGNITIML